MMRLATIGCLILGSVLTSAYARAEAPSDPFKPGMIEIGGGVGTASEGGLHAIFLVRTQLTAGGSRSSDQYILARINADGSFDSSGVSYLDVSIRGLGMQMSGYESGGALTLVNVSIRRDLMLGEELSASVHLIGFTGNMAFEMNDRMTFILNGAIDIVGLGLSERVSDGQRVEGISAGSIMGEVGLDFDERYRVVFGGRIASVMDGAYRYYAGRECREYYDDYYGEYYTRCNDVYDTGYNQRATSGSVYTTVTANLSKNFRAFGQASWNVYRMSDQQNSFTRSRDSGWRFRVGMSWHR